MNIAYLIATETAHRTKIENLPKNTETPPMNDTEVLTEAQERAPSVKCILKV